ncbi:MAG: hypothetical protein U1F60_12385 [Planctomycetota bacterium]
MIRLGDSSWWLDATAKGWVLLEVVGKGRKRVTRRLGEFTSLEHCLQQRAVRLPEEVRAELVELAAAGDEGVEALGEMPVAEEPG